MEGRHGVASQLFAQSLPVIGRQQTAQRPVIPLSAGAIRCHASNLIMNGMTSFWITQFCLNRHGFVPNPFNCAVQHSIDRS
jgi:hypothetical protein